MGGESEAAWRGILDGLIARGLRAPDFLITDGGAGLERALAALWPDVPAQRCSVHKHSNLLAHAPDALHEEVSADHTDMIYAETAKGVEAKRRAFLRKWRLRCPAAAASLEEAGDRLFACPRRSGSRRGPRTPSSGSTRSSSAGSRRKPCCPRPRPPPCCSGRCSRRAQRQTLRVSARSPCARSTDGRPWARSLPPPSPLTSPLDPSNYQPAGDTPLKLLPHKSQRHPEQSHDHAVHAAALADEYNPICAALGQYPRADCRLKSRSDRSDSRHQKLVHIARRPTTA